MTMTTNRIRLCDKPFSLAVTYTALATLWIFSHFGCSSVNKDSSLNRFNDYRDYTEVSIIALIANPEKYHGNRVSLSGFGRFEYEMSAIHLFADRAEQVSANAIWLVLSPEHHDQASARADGAFITITGVFNKDIRGHFGSYSGGVEEISGFYFYADRFKSVQESIIQHPADTRLQDVWLLE